MNTSKSAPANRPGLAAILLVAGVLALPALAAEEQPPPAGTAPAPKGAPAERLDQLVAPIALYPDPLLMQILMASTYPLEIVQAERWIKERPKLRGEELDKALEAQTWDASVESLTHFPDVLGRMSKNLDWTSELGDVFLAQQADVLDAIQRMRRKANQAGKLESTKQQQVVVEKEIIKIVPADPQIVYVPTYVPQAVYGPPAYPPPYPAMYAYPPGYVATTSLLSFGAGMAVGAAISGGCDWGRHEVNVYNNYGGGGGGGGNKNNNNVNIDNSKTFNQANVNKQKWEHNPKHRRGVSYQNQQVSQRYAGKGSQGQQTSDQARGYDRSANAAAQTRPATGAAAQTRPATGAATRPSGNDATARGAQGKQAPPTTRQSSRPATQQTASRGAGGGGRQDAFGGQGNGSAERSASARGASSRGSTSSGSTRQSGGGGGRPSGGSQQRGGGGGSRGGGGGGRRR